MLQITALVGNSVIVLFQGEENGRPEGSAETGRLTRIDRNTYVVNGFEGVELARFDADDVNQCVASTWNGELAVVVLNAPKPREETKAEESTDNVQPEVAADTDTEEADTNVDESPETDDEKADDSE